MEMEALNYYTIVYSLKGITKRFHVCISAKNNSDARVRFLEDIGGLEVEIHSIYKEFDPLMVLDIQNTQLVDFIEKTDQESKAMLKKQKIYHLIMGFFAAVWVVTMIYVLISFLA